MLADKRYEYIAVCLFVLANIFAVCCWYNGAYDFYKCLVVVATGKPTHKRQPKFALFFAGP